MKKVIAIFLAFFFSLSATGMQVTVHHCMGKTSFTVFGIDINKHCKCKHNADTHKPACCKHHTYSFEANDDPFTSSNKTISFQQFSLGNFYVSHVFIIPELIADNNFSFKSIHSPPEWDIQLHSLFCNYRI